MPGKIQLVAVGGDDAPKRMIVMQDMLPKNHVTHEYMEAYIQSGEERQKVEYISNRKKEEERDHYSWFPAPTSLAPIFKEANARLEDSSKRSKEEKKKDKKDAIVATERDTVLLIGHTSMRASIAEQMLKIQDGARVFVQGPGFNIPKATLTALSQRCRVEAYTAEQCPVYTLGEWEPLLEKYPAQVKQLQAYGLAAFFLSRKDGSFHRQFSMTQFTENEKKKFEYNVAEKLQKVVTNSKLQGNLTVILEFIDSENDAFFKWGQGRTGGTEENWLKLFDMWKNHVFDWLKDQNDKVINEVMHHLKDVLIKELGSTAKAKEYDAYVCHNMLHHNVPEENQWVYRPDAEIHYHLLQQVLQVDSSPPQECKSPEEECIKKVLVDAHIQHLVDGLHAILKDGNLVIVHDLGLDPMVDDFLAIELINYLHGILQKRNDEELRQDLEQAKKEGKAAVREAKALLNK